LSFHEIQQGCGAILWETESEVISSQAEAVADLRRRESRDEREAERNDFQASYLPRCLLSVGTADITVQSKCTRCLLSVGTADITVQSKCME
jgi:hypothetical protein